MKDIIFIKTPIELSELLREANECRRKIYTIDKDLEANNQEVQYIDLGRMNKVIEIDNDNLVAVAEPGIKMEDLRRELSKKRLRFIPATPDKDNISLGEMFRKKISSINSMQYGAAKHHVMGLDVILSPSGETLRTGGKTVKNVTGFDLTKLFISSYESLGIPVSYILKLFPLPEKKVFVVMKAEDDNTLLNIAMKIREYISPTVLYFINTQIVQYNNNSPANSWLLASFEGYEDTVNLRLQLLEFFIKDEIKDFEMLTEDIFYNQIKQITKNKQALIDRIKLPGSQWKHITKTDRLEGYFGQIDDGKLNIYLKERGELIQVQEMIEKLGGYFDNKELSAISKGLKRVMDPNNILNPWVMNGRLLYE